MPYVKLDCGMLNSTLWIDREARELFITALLLAYPQEFTEPIQQIHVDSLEHTGWSAPPGWYGFVPAAGVGLIFRSGVDNRATGIEALRRLGEPESDSRSQEFEGRRMIRVNGGYLVLKYMDYRDKDHTSADRQRRYRERKRLRRDSVTLRSDDTLCDSNVTHSIEHRADNNNSEPNGSSSLSLDKPVLNNISEDNSSSVRGTRLNPDWQLPEDYLAWAAENYSQWDLKRIRAVADGFRDYWISIPGGRGLKSDWFATWRNWCRREVAGNGRAAPERPKSKFQRAMADYEKIHGPIPGQVVGGDPPSLGGDAAAGTRLLTGD